jgi:hypothetical protein
LIRCLNFVPRVEVSISVDPKEALPWTRVHLRPLVGAELDPLPVPLDPHPYSNHIQAGFYAVSATIHDRGRPPFQNQPDRPLRACPPRCQVKVRVR